MYEEILFHGTEIERGEIMLKWNHMFLSSGDKHWLGDGSYFYEDDFYAYKWIKDMCICQVKIGSSSQLVIVWMSSKIYNILG